MALCITVYVYLVSTRGETGRSGYIDFRGISNRQNRDDDTEAKGSEVKRTERGVGHVKQEEKKERRREKERVTDAESGPALTQITDQLHFGTDAILIRCRAT